MKKPKTIVAVIAMALAFSSCVVYSQHQTTGNPVGTKVGYTKAKVKKNFEGIAGAAKKGGISKIGTVDIKYYLAGKVSIRVTGE